MQLNVKCWHKVPQQPFQSNLNVKKFGQGKSKFEQYVGIIDQIAKYIANELEKRAQLTQLVMANIFTQQGFAEGDFMNADAVIAVEEPYMLGRQGFAVGEFMHSVDFCLGPHNQIIVADKGNNRVHH